MILKHIITKDVININTKPIVLDINKKFYDILTAKQGDTKSRFLFFKLLDRSIPLDLLGKKVICYLVKPDSKKVFNYLVINDAKKGYCTLELTNQVLAVNGIANLELMITQEDKKLTTIPFKLEVVKSLNDGFIESTHEFNALMDCLASVEAWDKEFEDKSGKLEELYTPRLSELSSQMEEKASKNETKNIQGQIDALVLGAVGDGNNAEVIQARTSLDGTICDTLKNAIDKNATDLKNNLKDTDIYMSPKSTNLYRYPYDLVVGKFINVAGDISNSPTSSLAKIRVSPNTRYSLWRKNGSYGINSGWLLFLNALGEKTSMVDASTKIEGTYNEKDYITFDTPNDCAYITYNTKINAFESEKNLIVCEGKKIRNEINELCGSKITDPHLKEVEDMLNNFVDSVETIERNVYDYRTDYINDRFVNVEDGNISPANGWGVAKIKVEQGIKYCLITPSNIYGTRVGALSYFNNNVLIERVRDTTTIVGGTINNVRFLTFTTPLECTHVAFTCKSNGASKFDDSTTSMVIKKEIITTEDIENLNILKSIKGITIKTNSNNNLLKGMKWCVVGDSLSEKNIRATKNYLDYIAEETGINVINLGRSGTGYKKTEEVGTAFYQRVNQIPLDVDIITFFGSGNDLSLPLGVPTDNTLNTICGCMNETFKRLFEHIPGARVGVALPCPWGRYPPTTENNKMILYSEALREICKFYSIPILDLYYGSNLRPWDVTFKELYYKRDDGNSVHPDEDGHKILSRKFLNFIQGL